MITERFVKRFIRAMLATITLGLTVGVVPATAAGAIDFEDAAVFHGGQTPTGTADEDLALDSCGSVYLSCMSCATHIAVHPIHIECASSSCSVKTQLIQKANMCPHAMMRSESN